jgi:hypothetical protein
MEKNIKINNIKNLKNYINNMQQNKYTKVEKVIAERNRFVSNLGGTTGYKGVTLDKRHSTPRFQSKFNIRSNNKQVDICLGSYNTAEEAYIARIKFIDSLR